MSDMLRDPAVGVVVAIIFGVAGLIASVIAIRISHRRKKLSYGILPPVPLVTVHEEAKDDVQVLFNKILVADVQLLRIFIANTGNVPINDNDFRQSLKILFGDGARILTASVANAFPPELRPVTSYDEAEVQVAPLLLNESDWFELNVLLTKFDGMVAVDGRINGVKLIGEFNANKLVLKRTRMASLNILLQFLSITSLVVFAYVISIVQLPTSMRLPLLILLAVTSVLGVIIPDKIQAPSG